MESSGMSPADFAAISNGGAEGGSFFWIFALLILLFGGGNGFGFGNRNGSGITEYELGNLAGNNATKDNQMALMREIDNKACETNSNINTAATNLGNGICNLGYESLRNSNNTQQAIGAVGTQLADCCCQTKQAIGEVRYDMANFASSINANTTAQVQKVLDSLCTNRMADMQNQINNLQLQSALCGVVRYPTPAYIANTNGCGCACN